jgi:hypothetical protein
VRDGGQGAEIVAKGSRLRIAGRRGVPAPDVGAGGQASPLRVVVISRDRHYRAAMALLLARRDCSVEGAAGASELAALEDRGRCDVVVLDAGGAGVSESLAALERIVPVAAIVVVADESATAGDALVGRSGGEVLAKWGPFADLFAAIERAALRSRGPSRRQPLEP